MIGQNSGLSGKCHKWCTHIYSFMDHNIKMMKNTVFIVDNNVYWKWHLKCIHSSIYLKTNVKGYGKDKGIYDIVQYFTYPSRGFNSFTQAEKDDNPCYGQTN